MNSLDKGNIANAKTDGWDKVCDLSEPGILLVIPWVPRILASLVIKCVNYRIHSFSKLRLFSTTYSS